jgi:uncharacterized protein YjbI with pentapeptide repeats
MRVQSRGKRLLNMGASLRKPSRVRIAMALLASTIAVQSEAADLSARDVTVILFESSYAAPADFSGKDLSYLDLAGLDFKGARLSHANLSGSDLTGANLSNTHLRGALLDRATIIRANFENADLRGASLRGSSGFSGKDGDWSGAPDFSNADLSGARITARLDGTRFAGANLTNAVIGPQPAVWGSYKPRAIFDGCNFAGAVLSHANLNNTSLRYTKFAGADLSRAKLKNSDFTKSDLSGADLSGADVTNADFDGSKLDHVIGIESAIGVATARHLDLPDAARRP